MLSENYGFTVMYKSTILLYTSCTVEPHLSGQFTFVSTCMKVIHLTSVWINKAPLYIWWINICYNTVNIIIWCTNFVNYIIIKLLSRQTKPITRTISTNIYPTWNIIIEYSENDPKFNSLCMLSYIKSHFNHSLTCGMQLFSSSVKPFTTEYLVLQWTLPITVFDWSKAVCRGERV